MVFPAPSCPRLCFTRVSHSPWAVVRPCCQSASRPGWPDGIPGSKKHKERGKQGKKLSKRRTLTDGNSGEGNSVCARVSDPAGISFLCVWVIFYCFITATDKQCVWHLYHRYTVATTETPDNLSIKVTKRCENVWNPSIASVSRTSIVYHNFLQLFLIQVSQLESWRQVLCQHLPPTD